MSETTHKSFPQIKFQSIPLIGNDFFNHNCAIVIKNLARQTSTIHLPNVGSMLVQCLRCWTYIKPALSDRSRQTHVSMFRRPRIGSRRHIRGLSNTTWSPW